LRILILIPLLLVLCTKGTGQTVQADTGYMGVSDKALHFIDTKYAKLTTAVDKQTLKLVERMQRKEAKLQRKLQGIDSTKAIELFTGTQDKYNQLQTKLQSPVTKTSNALKEYLPGIDSMQTSLQFLSSGKLPIPADKLATIQNITKDAQQLQDRLQQANEVQSFIKEREQLLKDQLAKYGLGKQLLGINKEVYYYQQQLQQYKELINDPEKLGEAILAKVRTLPAFQSFWERNSILSQLFPIPQNNGTSIALTGLQSRGQVASIISQRLPGAFTSNGNGTTNYLQQQMQTAQTQMNSVKDKIAKLGGGSSDMMMPDFQPSSQKNKSFLKRLEYGMNFQTTPATKQLPTISDIGLTLGYKFSDKAVMGIGLSYKLGLGRGFNRIAFTNEGISTRSYMDIKAKGSIWITAGYEYSFMQRFVKLSEIRANTDIWQKSALIGITKKYKIGKNKQGNIQLLYDFLYKYESPRGQALKFRVGYKF